MPDDNFSTQRLLIGTHTNGTADHIKIAELKMPLNNEDLDIRKYDDVAGELGGYEGQCKVHVTQQIDHQGEVNRARYMPQNPDLIATMAPNGSAYLFDRTQHPNNPTGKFNPQIRLLCHESEGYGLAWNPNKEGQMVTGAMDSVVALWDVSAYSKANVEMKPIRVIKSHSAPVNDVAFHCSHAALFASVSDDCTVQLHDTRASETQQAHTVKAHGDFVNAVAFSPMSEYVLATGSKDSTIGLWDMRNLKLKLHSFEAHESEITGLAWSPHEETILASGSSDRRVILWDLSKIGDEQSPDDAEDGPAELLVF